MAQNPTERSLTDRIVWIDCEMTGLSLDDRRPRSRWRRWSPTSSSTSSATASTSSSRPPAEALEQMDDFVRDMHTTSGLLDELDRRASRWRRPRRRCSTTSASGCPSRARRRSAATPSPPTGASSPATCPSSRPTCTTGSSTSPRSRSCRAGGTRGPTSTRPKKSGGHRALADIRESIAELRYYREAVFVPPPGPDTDTAQAIAARHVDRAPEQHGPYAVWQPGVVMSTPQ